MKPQLTLQANETILLEVQPDRKIVVYWLLTRWYLWVMVFLVANVLIMIGVIRDAGYPTATAIALTLIAMILGGLWINYARTWHWYILTTQRCLVYRGFISVQKRLIPYSRIVDTDVAQSPIERLLGLGSVRLNVPSFTVTGSGQQSNLTVLMGIPIDQCEQILATISQKNT